MLSRTRIGRAHFYDLAHSQALAPRGIYPIFVLHGLNVQGHVPAPGYTPLVGALVSMLDYTRATTIAAVEGLSQSELDHQYDPAANPIGALLAHIGAIEWSYVAGTLGGSPPSDADWAEWGPLFRLGPEAWAAARGRTLEEHVARLAAVRDQTLTGLRVVDDDWLVQHATLPWLREPATHLWIWYHVMEDELNHRGQIRWLRGRLPVHGSHSPVLHQTTDKVDN